MRKMWLLSLLWFSACAGVGPQVRTQLDAIMAEPVPTCNASSCPEKWARARQWLALHAYHDISTATDMEMTVSPQAVSTDSSFYGYKVLRESGGADFKITLTPIKPTWGGVSNDMEKIPAGDTQRAFYHYVNTGTDLLAPVGKL